MARTTTRTSTRRRMNITTAITRTTIMTIATTKSGKEIKEQMKIKTLNDTSLVVTDQTGKVNEYKKK